MFAKSLNHRDMLACHASHVAPPERCTRQTKFLPELVNRLAERLPGELLTEIIGQTIVPTTQRELTGQQGQGSCGSDFLWDDR